MDDTIPQDDPPYKLCSNLDCEDPLLPAMTEYFSVQRLGLYGVSARCKTCASMQAKIYYQANRQRLIEKKCLYQRIHREQNRANVKKYNRTHKEQRAIYRKEHYRTNKEQNAAHAREYNQAHKEQNAIRQEKYRLAHLDKFASYTRNRKASKKASGTHTPEQIKEQYKRQKGKCYYCHKKVTWGEHHVDHVIPLSRGGSNDISNLVIACAPCNIRKHNKLPHEWPQGGRLL